MCEEAPRTGSHSRSTASQPFCTCNHSGYPRGRGAGFVTPSGGRNTSKSAQLDPNAEPRRCWQSELRCHGNDRADPSARGRRCAARRGRCHSCCSTRGTRRRCAPCTRAGPRGCAPGTDPNPSGASRRGGLVMGSGGGGLGPFYCNRGMAHTLAAYNDEKCTGGTARRDGILAM